MAAGPARRRWLENRLQEWAASGSRAWCVNCDFDRGGPWAGVNDLFLAWLPEIRAERPDLIARHAFELGHVLPQWKDSFTVSNPCLTDQAAPQEKVRNYAADRAFRIVHGLIDLLDSWKSGAAPEAAWAIACDDYDRAGKIGARFFRELMRRRGQRLRIRLLAGVSPGNGPAARESLGAGAGAAAATVDDAGTPAEVPGGETAIDRETAAGMAVDLEERLGGDRDLKRAHLPELIRLWSLAGRYDKVVRLRFFGVVVYIHLGLYEDGFRYVDGLLPLAQEHAPEDSQLRWWIIINTLNCLMGMQDADAGLEFVEREAAPVLHQADSEVRAQILYEIAMLYGRFKKPRDLAKGEEYLDRALAVIESSDLAGDDFHFQHVFNRNGVAMIRTFQGRHQDAIDLCRSGLERLETHLPAGKHQLHRSVLIYNIAQVYSAIGSHAEALRYYSEVIAMDPNYSEYHNERGSVFLKMGRLEEARADYLQAIELSPPYFEVFTNLGQCCRRMGRMEEAAEHYSRALDLEPDQPLALVGRAKAREELGHRDAAIADYTAALSRDARQWEAFASRGVLRYEAGDLEAALADFNQAIHLAPNRHGLFQNRAVVLADLGRPQEAARDLEAALGLNPPDQDRLVLQARLDGLLSSPAPAR